MSKYEGLYTFDVDNHRYIPVGQIEDDYFNVREEDPKHSRAQDTIDRMMSEIAYLKGKIEVYEKFLKDKGYIKEEEK